MHDMKRYKVSAHDNVKIIWNGSATFNVFWDGQNIDVFTVYGTADGDSYRCTEAEADAAVASHIADMGGDDYIHYLRESLERW